MGERRDQGLHSQGRKVGQLGLSVSLGGLHSNADHMVTSLSGLSVCLFSSIQLARERSKRLTSAT